MMEVNLVDYLRVLLEDDLDVVIGAGGSASVQAIRKYYPYAGFL